MKQKYIYVVTLFLSATMAFAACRNNNAQEPFKYRINGKGSFLPEQTEIILAHGIYVGHEPGNEQIITKMKVKNGTFSYEGCSEETEACMLYIPSEGAYLPVFIEMGNIQVSLDENPNKIFVCGTPLNDSLQMLAQKNIECSEKFKQQLKGVNDPPDNEDLERIQECRAMFLKDVGNIHYECAMRNINNELGFFLTVNGKDLFTRQQLKTLIGKLPKSKRNHPVIRKLETPVDKTIPSFSLPDEKGYSYNVKSLAKQYKVTILDFWASWCEPCMNEMTGLATIYREYNHQGLGVVGISLDKDKTAWTNACSKINAPWLQLWDNDGSVADMFQVNSIPHTVVVDKNGNVLATKLRGVELKNFVAEKLHEL